MKKTLFILSIVLFFTLNEIYAQKTFSDVVSYNNYIVEKHNDIIKKYLVYIKTSIHSNNAKKVDRKLDEMVKEITSVISDLEAITPIEADSAGYLRNTIESLKIEKAIYENDLEEVGILQEKSENSYEDMENYFKAEEEILKKMQEANLKTEKAQEKLAVDNGLLVSTQETKLSEEFERISKINSYSRQVYLQYFRAYKPVNQFFEAVNSSKYLEAENFNKKISETAQVSLDSLAVISSINGNSDLKAKAEALINFYKKFSENQFFEMMQLLQKENITNEDIEKVNSIIEDFNVKQTNYTSEFQAAYSLFLKTNIND